jgi:methylenetetrahydrofolate dehydrogenase (NADP+)/methenyltetrahydrofolate cyclohydrolase
LPTETEQDVVAQHILDLNQQDDLHGILIQSPLPKHMDEEMLTELIDPRKDVDGFHPVNLGRLVQGRSDGMVPCTPSGVMEMLSWANVDLTGKKAVVLGRSFNVGMPQALLMAAKVLTQPSRLCIPEQRMLKQSVEKQMFSLQLWAVLRW